MSGLDNYASAALNLADELRASLSDPEIGALHSALSGRPVIDWIRWRNENSGLVSEYVSATPSQRNQKKKFKEHRLYLIMAGVQQCLEAHALLAVVTNSWLTPGGSYRSMAADAGEAYNRLYEYDIPYWPFEQSESPFCNDPASTLGEP
jgi:hypothetical protein